MSSINRARRAALPRKTASLVALTVALAPMVPVAPVLLGATPVHATPWAVSSATRQAAQEGPRAGGGDAQPGPATVDEALEAGDLRTAAALAEQARIDDPNPTTWLQEARVHEQAGAYALAARSYRGAMRTAGDDAAAKAEAEEGLSRMRALSRGTVQDEPASTHREALDEAWNPPPEPKPEPTPPTDTPPPQEVRIVTKWYFWVTVGAIAASAAAVTAIAIRAARDDQPDALDALGRMPPPPRRGLGVLRF